MYQTVIEYIIIMMIEYEMLTILIRIVNFKTLLIRNARIKNGNEIGRGDASSQFPPPPPNLHRGL